MSIYFVFIFCIMNFSASTQMTNGRKASLLVPSYGEVPYDSTLGSVLDLFLKKKINSDPRKSLKVDFYLPTSEVRSFLGEKYLSLVRSIQLIYIYKNNLHCWFF